MGEGDLDWKASCEMKPESWEETEERRAGVCWGSTEEDEEEEVRKRKWEVGEWQWEPLERESLLFTLFRLLWDGGEEDTHTHAVTSVLVCNPSRLCEPGRTTIGFTASGSQSKPKPQRPSGLTAFLTYPTETEKNDDKNMFLLLIQNLQ